MKFNKKIFNMSAWIVVLLAYLLPSHNYGEFAKNFGYPFAYLTIYDNSLNKRLLSSFYINLGTLLINILIIYFIIYVVQKLLTKKDNINIY
ncbi:hypothetical protein ACQPVP_05535 [Clostridium nigeriense]|uniref:hypothetical protein n=1 Tax=Clostridium nigeriense TaxID=1805470 RepID=UPI003D32DEAE